VPEGAFATFVSCEASVGKSSRSAELARRCAPNEKAGPEDNHVGGGADRAHHACAWSLAGGAGKGGIGRADSHALGSVSGSRHGGHAPTGADRHAGTHSNSDIEFRANAAVGVRSGRDAYPKTNGRPVANPGFDTPNNTIPEGDA
jgi:hypothetical protein